MLGIANKFWSDAFSESSYFGGKGAEKKFAHGTNKNGMRYLCEENKCCMPEKCLPLHRGMELLVNHHNDALCF